jgi:hypothetical protein
MSTFHPDDMLTFVAEWIGDLAPINLHPLPEEL